MFALPCVGVVSPKPEARRIQQREFHTVAFHMMKAVVLWHRPPTQLTASAA